jgi:Do/DeqQ family serine protease
VVFLSYLYITISFEIIEHSLNGAMKKFFQKRPIKSTIVLFSLTFFLGLVVLEGARSATRRSPVVIAVEKVSPAVVNISTLVREQVRPFFPFSRDDFFRDFFPDFFGREYTRTSLGSGVIIDGSKGPIITNHDVVARATEIKVIASDKKEYQAKILGSDPRSDLAVLKIETKSRLPELQMGNSNDLMIGETVIAIGNPFGLSHTVTTGVVSALERSVRADERVYRHFIQTDASINPGNSGGPLLNIDGELIGINTAIYQKAQGIGFAIPINKAKRIVRELLRAGEVRFPWVGVEIQEITRELETFFSLPKGGRGVLVSDVMEESPALRAGLKRGDVLLKIEDTDLESPEDYRQILSEFTPSDPLRVSISRKGKRKDLMVHPATFPLEQAVGLAFIRLGIKVGDMDRPTKRRLGQEGGVLIEEVLRNSEAGKIGLERGDLILKINDLPIKNLDAFKRAISRNHHQPSLTLIVQRGAYGYSLTLPF